MSFVTNIQKYCIHDGKGIRTTVFFKGCPLVCQWCHNPETQDVDREIRFFEERCIVCKRCVAACQKNAFSVKEDHIRFDRSKCVRCGRCAQVCQSQALEVIGKCYDVQTLVKMLAKDQMFYEESDGGVTLSGGEVMMVSESYLIKLVKGLFDEGISVNIDTCGFCKWSRLETLLPYVDTFLYDVKLLDEAEHQHFTGVSNPLILGNLKRLSAAGAKIWIRVPVIKGVNGDRNFAEKLGYWLRQNCINPEQIHILKYHDFGTDKYKQLGMTYQGEHFEAPGEDELKAMEEVLSHMGFRVHIGG